MLVAIMLPNSRHSRLFVSLHWLFVHTKNKMNICYSRFFVEPFLIHLSLRDNTSCTFPFKLKLFRLFNCCTEEMQVSIVSPSLRHLHLFASNRIYSRLCIDFWCVHTKIKANICYSLTLDSLQDVFHVTRIN